MPDIVILTTGQSNMKLAHAYTWTPPANLKAWNGSDTVLGNAFVTPPQYMGTAYAFAEACALDNPSDDIYLINISSSGKSIHNWLPSPPVIDMYAAIKTNVEAALSILGVTKIDIFGKWHGESGIAYTNLYRGYLNQFLDNIRTETWFPANTPMLLWGVTSSEHGGGYGYSAQNYGLQDVRNADPANRKYFHTASIPTMYWDGVTHMTVQGYRLAGKGGWDTFAGKIPQLTQPPFILDTDTRFMTVSKGKDVDLLLGEDQISPFAAKMSNLVGSGAPYVDDTQIPQLTFGGSSVGVVQTTQKLITHVANGICTHWITIALSNKGSHPTNAVAQIALPNPIAAIPGVGSYVVDAGLFLNMSGIVGDLCGQLFENGANIRLMNGNAATTPNLTWSNFTNTSLITARVSYPIA